MYSLYMTIKSEKGQKHGGYILKAGGFGTDWQGLALSLIPSRLA